MIEERRLSRDQIKEIWAIDRSEVIDGVYYIEDGTLVLKPEHYDVRGWPPGMPETSTPILEDCYDRGGVFWGLYDGERLVGVGVLDVKLMGKNNDQLQLLFLHVSRADRDRGLGRQLFDAARAEARKRGAKSLYVPATPSEHTVGFYMGLGCRVTAEPDPALFELEPEDIHFECALD
jgi:predicted N-acetyltransferase YhbS